MNTPQRFFGFLLLPILAFVLGVSFADEFSPSSAYPQKNIPREENTVRVEDILALRKIVQQWEQYAEPSEGEQISSIYAKLDSLEDVVQHQQQLDLDIFWEVLTTLQTKYVHPEDIDAEKIVAGAIRGMVMSLGDPYSTYMTREESKNFGEELAGKLEGIGAELTMKNGLITIVSPLKNSPASQAGLLPEDIIVEVDGVSTEGKNLSEVVEKIRGPEGTLVSLSVVRKNQPEVFAIEIKRKNITIESVELEIRENIAIIDINQFGDNTEQEFIKYLREALSQGIRGIILDMRFNPGGYLETAVDITSAFVPEGKVVIEKERSLEVLNRFVNGKVLTDLPVVVLINKGSASASEIVAGALQDHDRAIIVGEQSFGKGTVQELTPISDGSYLRITVARWLTPHGHDIGKQGGIIPDVLIARTPQDYEQEKDPQLDAAMKILLGEDSSEE